LTEVAVKKHVQWAKDNKSHDWNTVLWTDESTIELGKCPGCQFVAHWPGKNIPECIQPTFHSGHKLLMVWGVVAHRWKRPLIRLNMLPEEEDRTKKQKKKGRGLNGSKYVSQVLRRPLKDFIEEIEGKRGHDMLVVEDGAPGHTSKIASRAQSELGINKLTHPPKSPDLDSIEPLWYLIKTHIADIPGSSNSLNNFWEAVQQVWDEITPDEIEQYTGKMKDQVEAVRTAKGWHTKF
jgi:hypothetical protein